MAALWRPRSRRPDVAQSTCREKRPSRTGARAVLREVRRRVQEGLELEYQTAMRAEKHAGSRGARALFLTQWVETGWRGCTGRVPTYAHEGDACEGRGRGGADCAGHLHTPGCDARDGEGHTHWRACGEGKIHLTPLSSGPGGAGQRRGARPRLVHCTRTWCWCPRDVGCRSGIYVWLRCG